MCRSAVFTEMPSAAAICLVWRPRAKSPITVASRSVSPAGLAKIGTGWPAVASTAATASASRRPALTSSAIASAAPAGLSAARCGRAAVIAV